MEQEPKTPRERAEGLISLLVSDWRPTPRQVLWVIMIAFILSLLVVIGYTYGATLWDWIRLLIVPAVIAGGGFWFNAQQRDREHKLANEHAQDEALQAYLDQMSRLLTDEKRPLHRAQPGDSLSTVARARTLTVLSRLDGDRKRSAVTFLYESGLILITKRRPVLNLSAADLIGANLRGANLPWANLSAANLHNANLFRANLFRTDLSSAKLGGATLLEASLDAADLSGADLSDADIRRATSSGAIFFWADLSSADLRGADLRGANLNLAILRGADLRGADLSDADLSDADLRGANLQGARGLSQEQIDLTRGTNKTTNHSKKTELPEGLNRPQWWSKSFEEQSRIVQKAQQDAWLKGQKSKEDGENSDPS